MESIIKWQTGTPTEPGKYLISDKHYNVDSDWWTRKDGWDRHYDEDIMGWCKLSDIDGFNYMTSNEN